MSGYQGNVVFDGPQWLTQHDCVIATISQSEELFDCFPAINAAFAFTKSYSKQGQELDEQCKWGRTWQCSWRRRWHFGIYMEFGMFLQQYYVYCKELLFCKEIEIYEFYFSQIFKNDDVQDDFMIENKTMKDSKFKG